MLWVSKKLFHLSKWLFYTVYAHSANIQSCLYLSISMYTVVQHTHVCIQIDSLINLPTHSENQPLFFIGVLFSLQAALHPSPHATPL